MLQLKKLWSMLNNQEDIANASLLEIHQLKQDKNQLTGQLHNKEVKLVALQVEFNDLIAEYRLLVGLDEVRSSSSKRPRVSSSPISSPGASSSSTLLLPSPALPVVPPFVGKSLRTVPLANPAAKFLNLSDPSDSD